MGEFQNYIDKGGVIFTILLVMSAIGTTIIIYKFIELYLFNNDKLLNYDDIRKVCLKYDLKIEELINKLSINE